jgi:CheR methyltransferase, SAM binding domain
VLKTASAASISVRVFSLLIFCLYGLPAHTADSTPRYLSFSEAQETLRLYAGSGSAASEATDAAAWDHWIREEDQQVRSRIDGGLEDSISNLILYGTSFTALPRLESSARAITEDGQLAPLAQSRVRALLAALSRDTGNERVQFVREYLAQKQIGSSSRERLLADDLIRFAKEQMGYEERLQKAQQQGDADVFSTRATLYDQRGLSVDTSLLPNFALEEALRSLKAKGILKPASMRSVAVVGPGLDFADKREGYDFYPLQTIQPFAALETVLRLGLGNERDIRIMALDLNAEVNAHIAKVAARGVAGRACVVELPRNTDADWNDAAIAYWEHFGEWIGAPRKPLPVPQALPGVSLRAIAIRPKLAARLEARDLNIVAQRIDFPKDRGFDLVVATNILVYYDTFQQALAMSNIAAMMNSGGILLANNPLPTAHDHRLTYLGRKTIPFAKNGAYGDDVVVYMRE